MDTPSGPLHIVLIVTFMLVGAGKWCAEKKSQLCRRRLPLTDDLWQIQHEKVQFYGVLRIGATAMVARDMFMSCRVRCLKLLR